MSEQFERYVMVFSDGSMGVAEDQATLRDVLKNAAEDDPRETDPRKFVRVVKAKIEIVEDYGFPRTLKISETKAEKCPTCGRAHALGSARP